MKKIEKKQPVDLNSQSSGLNRTAFNYLSSYLPPPEFSHRPECKVKQVFTQNYCCFHYEVVCDGATVWTGSSLCDWGCLIGSAFNHPWNQ